MAVELLFAIVNELYTLSSAWNIRRTLLAAAKSFLLRPGNPSLISIQSMLQTSVIEANWTTLGRLLPGQLVSGERTLVYAGTLTADTLEDQLLVRLRSPADWNSAGRRLNFHFELDTD